KGDVSSMSCRRTYGSAPTAQTTTQCVTDIVRKILNAQRKVLQAGGEACLTSCDQSIKDLLASPGYRPTRHNTIPFILYSKNFNKPFFGSGFCIDENGMFNCVESPVFRVKGFSKGSSNCAVLELLTPVVDNNDGDGGGDSGLFQNENGVCGSVCEYFGTQEFSNFEATGICITVDLSCFCGISCLPAITPVINNDNVTGSSF